MTPAQAGLVILGKVLLVAATLLCLSSIGGAMLFAFPVLVPLHWLAARSAPSIGRLGWAFLAGASLFEAGWMLTYIATERAAVSVAVGGLLGLAGAMVIARSRPSAPVLVAQTRTHSP